MTGDVTDFPSGRPRTDAEKYDAAVRKQMGGGESYRCPSLSEFIGDPNVEPIDPVFDAIAAAPLPRKVKVLLILALLNANEQQANAIGACIACLAKTGRRFRVRRPMPTRRSSSLRTDASRRVPVLRFLLSCPAITNPPRRV